MLQWGRDRLIAEINHSSVEEPEKVDASMGPRSTDRGNDPEYRGHGHGQRLASMGPRSTDRGNCQILSGIGVSWHASMGPRSTDRGNKPADDLWFQIRRLQWGRDRLIAEMSGMTNVASACVFSFNGAAID